MKIMGSVNTLINGITPKVVETGEGFLINTQYYNKEKLAPVPLEFAKVVGSPYALNIRKNLFLQAPGWRLPDNTFNIYKDSTIPNRYYVRVFNGYVESTTISTSLLVLEEGPGQEFKCLNISTFNELEVVDILDQDDNFLFIELRGPSAQYIYAFSKTAYTVVSKWSLASVTRNYIKLCKTYSDATNIHFMYIFDQNIYLVIFNKVTQTFAASTPIYRGKEETTSLNIISTNIDQAYRLDDDTTGMYMINSADPVQPIDFYYYDRSKSVQEGFNMIPVEITWNDQKSKLDFTIGTVYNTLRMFISEFDSIKYLNIFSYQTQFQANTAYTQTQGLYTFRIDSVDKMTLVGYNPVDRTKLIGGFIYDESMEHLIVAKLNAFQILKFNKETLTYEDTSMEIPSCYSVGLDELQRIWYIKTDSTVHMINMEDAQSVDIKFEKPYYDYSGTAINTYIDFSALNYLGELFAGTFELTINGPAVFTDNASNFISIDYDGLETKQIDITIVGAAPITIYPKFIKPI